MSIKIGSRPAKQIIKSYTDVLLFGKYKGHTIEWLLNNDEKREPPIPKSPDKFPIPPCANEEL